MVWPVGALYGLAAIASAFRWRHSWRINRAKAEHSFWLVLTVGLALFGMNKLADLQTPLLRTLKRVAQTLGLEAFRSELKSLLLVAVVVGTVMVATGLLVCFRKALRRHWDVGLGGLVLGSYYVIRAAVFLNLAPAALHDPRVALLEIAGLLIILIGACRRGALV